MVELSIVLVILGLLTGGILAGQSLIRASELRAATTEYNRYMTAIRVFRDKYFAVPGDFANATQFFGRQISGTNCLYSAGTSVTSNGACNGTGDGTVSTSWGGGGAGNIDETLQFWRHLALAGLIEGNYSGTYTTTTYACDPDGNCPPSKLGSSAQWDAYSGVTVWSPSASANYLYVGSTMAGNSGGSVLKPDELWGIDSKMDDGVPGTGNVRAGNSASCWTGSGSTAVYALTGTSKTCYAEFKAW